MDIVNLRRKLSTYVSEAGRLRNVSEEVLCEVLVTWEDWTGSASEFYRSLGFTQKQMAKLLGKAKRLKRDGHFGSSEFKQVKIDLPPDSSSASGPCAAAELVLGNGQLVRFSGVDHLMDFLKKSA